ncbi:hypothetical protein BXO88_06900 [Oribacterium sp. C9]|uniref:electron transfer flavoprotein subunit beta/FixA family protein n=1 Tax=Oribacterium sp. C9 TaxID=1943579 RepID=UPI00098F3A31|nr:hypothetical protein [Oribacterium sp. C9]OON86713.1 hypothetical protein BXO88_06900 [Oribacterium sp. C9]
MKILVLIKQVPDDVVKVSLSDEKTPDIKNIEKIVNAMDTYAMEMAVREMEANGGEVVVASIGDKDEIRPSLVQEIAVGANRAYIGNLDVSGADEAALSAELLSFIRKIEEQEGSAFDLILTGKESTDEISSQVGALLAEKLSVPFVSSAIGFTKTDAALIVKKETEEGYDVLETTLPAVLSVTKPEYDPRYPSLKNKMKARKAEIPVIELEKAENKVTLTGYDEPAKREAGVKIKEKEAQDAVQKAMAILKEARLV